MSIDQETSDRLVLWSPSLVDRNGQNIVTELVLTHFLFEEVFCYRVGGRLVSIAMTICTSVRLILRLWVDRRRKTIVYAVISRSFFGVLRDLPIYFFASASKFVLHVHGAEVMQKRVLLVVSCLIRVLSIRTKCTVVVPSQRVGAELRRKCAGAVVIVVENPCITKVAHSAAPASKMRVLWSSNLMEEKGYLDFLEAVESANLYARADIEIVVCGQLLGSSSFKQKVNEKHRNLVGLGSFTYIGSIDGSKIRQELLRATHVILPTKYRTECQPLSLIEAMCSGKILIISSLPAVIETVGDYPTYQFSPGDINGLGHVMTKAIYDYYNPHSEFMCPSLADSENARNRFGVDRFLSSMQTALALEE